MLCVACGVVASLALGACRGKAPGPAVAIGGGGVVTHAGGGHGGFVVAALRKKRLAEAPLTELAFAPADAEAIVRVDLAALAERDPDTQQMLDFLLRAQQPQAWQFLSDAGIRVGKELRAIYLVVGPRAASTSSIMLAGVGDIDARRAIDAFARAGGKPERGPGGSTILVWGDGAAPSLGATVRSADGADGAWAVGVADGLLVVGPPAPVRRAMAVRAGEGKDVREGPLADALGELDAGAVVWGVARDGDEGLVRQLAPGLELGRFDARLAHVGAGAIDLEASFATAAQATAFQAQLRGLVGAAALMTARTPMGDTLSKLRDVPIEVDGTVVRVEGEL
jgi:hypothetical protein